jgi:SpoVK/Ycf46/Vps4 family AAA+-type ATPase
VIGATNRIDAIDPALRRPGRFDREFMFTLPSRTARRKIFGIQARKWDPPLPPTLVNTIADACVGYCGADLKVRLELKD